jgi:hypothetical protein
MKGVCQYNFREEMTTMTPLTRVATTVHVKIVPKVFWEQRPRENRSDSINLSVRGGIYVGGRMLDPLSHIVNLVHEFMHLQFDKILISLI